MCNNDNSVLQNFSQGRVSSCRTCSDHLDDPNTQSDCAQSNAVSMPCPIFADAGCFSSRVATESTGVAMYSSDTYHGCSNFRITQDSKTCFNIKSSVPNFENPTGEEQTQSICKETCGTNDCNYKLTEIPGGGDPVSHHYCYSCSVTVDHLNQTVGNGDELCWNDPAEAHQIECPAGYNFCITDMEVDWMAQGIV